MDLITLRVINTIFKLGITEDEFKDIEEEQVKDHSGIYIAAIKGDVAICINHDDKHRIMVTDKIGDVSILPSRILLKTLTYKDVPEQVYLLHRIGKYKNVPDIEFKHTANNIDELKDRILHRFMDGYPQELGGEYDDVFADAKRRKVAQKKKPELVINQLKALYWLFGEEYDGKEIYSRFNIPRIIKVWQIKNTRVALFQEVECWTYKQDGMFHVQRDIDRVTYRIKAYTPKDKEYNYVDLNREVGLVYDNDNFAEVWIDDSLFEKVQSDEIEVIQKFAKRDEFWFIDADDMIGLRADIDKESKQLLRSKVEEETKEKLIDNIRSQFKNGAVVRHGIKFTPNSFSYEGIAISGDKMGEFMLRDNIIMLEHPDFNQIVDRYIEYILEIHSDYNYYPSNRTMSFLKGEKNIKIGEVNIKVTRDKMMNVNGYRIAREEVEEVMKQAIKYKSTEDYNLYLEGVSKISLKLQKILERGYFEFQMDVDNIGDCCLNLKEKKIMMAIPVIRENNKNYILVKNKRFTIKNIVSFYNLDGNKRSVIWRYEGSEIQRLIVQLHKSVNGITPQDISVLIREGIKNYRKKVIEQKRLDGIKIKKSIEFLNNAIRLTKAVKVKRGYVVKGLSGAEYLVSENLEVHRGEEYICIVDDRQTDTNTEWGKNDALAKRLLLLSKDLKVADEVRTLGLCETSETYANEVEE